MLARCGLGVGSLALTALLADEGRLCGRDNTPLDPKKLTGKAKSLILLFMGGGPSQVDTFDPKPLLSKLNGQSVPEEIARGIPKVARAPLTGLLGSPYTFKKYGQSGLPVSDLFPHVGACADDICVIRSCRHDSPIHAPAEYIATTGSAIGDRPSVGAWLHYGLGSETRDLPGYVVMKAGDTGRPAAWSNGFLPARHQGIVCGAAGVPNVAMPAGVSSRARAAQLDLLGELNRRHAAGHPGDTGLDARVRSFELAARMQIAAPEAFDLARELPATKQLYGLDDEDTAEFGGLCLIARRLVERGVRIVQLRHGGWDAHESLKKNHTPQARQTDKPIAGLLQDLKRTELLDSTLVVWGGEFGRTPTAENPGSPSPGRNHSPSGYSVWFAGGGVKGGQAIGATDEVGYAAVERPVSPHDLHATLLHAFGIDQHALYYVHDNRKELVTVNGGEVIAGVFK
ncbi:MAG: hypothetical protein JWO38_2108 [Gemmataceae bacterium]|nr:hypothetical protein [Gemmataceae bacterium]